MTPVGVMIVDDQSISRQLFEMYVNSSDNYRLICSVESAAYADLFVLRGNIDLILMDILMNDGSNGLSAAQEIKRIMPEIKIIAVTSMPEVSWLDRAKEIGIESFWYKESSRETILEVMDRTMAGESVYPENAPAVQLGYAKSSDFTKRELDVLRVMTAGVSNAVIAEKLGISEHTVKMHVKHLIEKTGCENRTQLAIRARVSGLVISDDV